MPHARFKISKGSDGQYTFNLIAANGEKILTSERYTARASAEGGIAAVRTNAAIDSQYDRRRSKDDQHYFVLQAGNGAVIGVSETYTSTAARENGIASVKSNAPTAAIEG